MDGKHARLAFACDGTCESALPIDSDLGLTWYRRSAERRALAVQAYKTALARVQEKVAAGIAGP